MTTSYDDFVAGWKAESNAWREAVTAREELAVTYFRFFCFGALYVVLLGIVKAYAVRQKGNTLAKALSARPLLVNLTLHGSSMWLVAVLLATVNDDALYAEVWQKVMLPQSIAYYFLDTLAYAIPQGDFLIIAHHTIMCLFHFPLTSRAGATLAGAGDHIWAVRLSVLGYACAELCVPILNARWLASFYIRAEASGVRKKDRESPSHEHVHRIFHVASVIAFSFRAIALVSLLVAGLMPRARTLF